MSKMTYPCPACGKRTEIVEIIKRATIATTLINLEPDGSVEYGEMDTQLGETDHYECAMCQNIFLNDKGRTIDCLEDLAALIMKPAVPDPVDLLTDMAKHLEESDSMTAVLNFCALAYSPSQAATAITTILAKRHTSLQSMLETAGMLGLTIDPNDGEHANEGHIEIAAGIAVDAEQFEKYHSMLAKDYALAYPSDYYEIREKIGLGGYYDAIDEFQESNTVIGAHQRRDAMTFAEWYTEHRGK